MDDLSIIGAISPPRLEPILLSLKDSTEPAANGQDRPCFNDQMIEVIGGKLLQRNYSISMHQLCLLVHLIHRLNLNLSETAFMPRAGIERIFAPHHHLTKQDQINFTHSKQIKYTFDKDKSHSFAAKSIHELLCWYQIIMNLLWQEGEGLSLMEIEAIYAPLQQDQLSDKTLKSVAKALNAKINDIVNKISLPHQKMNKIGLLRQFLNQTLGKDYHEREINSDIVLLFWRTQNQEIEGEESTNPAGDFVLYQGVAEFLNEYKTMLRRVGDYQNNRVNRPLSLDGFQNTGDGNADSGLDHLNLDQDANTFMAGYEEPTSLMATLEPPQLNGIKLFSLDDSKLLKSLETLGILDEKWQSSKAMNVQSDLIRGLYRYHSFGGAQNNLRQAVRDNRAGILGDNALMERFHNPISKDYEAVNVQIKQLLEKVKQFMADVAGILIHKDEPIAYLLLCHILPDNWKKETLPILKENSPKALIRTLRDKNKVGEWNANLLVHLESKATKLTRAGFQGDYDVESFRQAALGLDRLWQKLSVFGQAFINQGDIMTWFEQDKPHFLSQLRLLYDKNRDYKE